MATHSGRWSSSYAISCSVRSSRDAVSDARSSSGVAGAKGLPAAVSRYLRRKAALTQQRQARSAGSRTGRSSARTAPLETRPERACAAT